MKFANSNAQQNDYAEHDCSSNIAALEKAESASLLYNFEFLDEDKHENDDKIADTVSYGRT